MKKKTNPPLKVLIIFYLIFISACTQYPKTFKPIFKEAGKNQSELKKVIRNYSHHPADSLKRKAALFLIENMDVHYSYKGKAWEQFCCSLDSMFEKETKSEKMTSTYDSLFNVHGDAIERGLYIVPDLKVITAKYLINNIDLAFLAWKSPYSRHLNFDEFCEYLLPYRIDDEPIEDWRTLYRDKFIPPLLAQKKVELSNQSNIEICKVLKDAIYNSIYFYPISIPNYGPRLLTKLKMGICRDFSHQGIFAARSIGLPISIDYAPHWATRSMGHEWNALLNYDKKSLDFAIGSWDELGTHLKSNADWLAPKVYRQTYAKQKESLAMIHGQEEIPGLFSSPCFKDVSNDYFHGLNIAVDLKTVATHKNKFAYLAVFDNRDWVPIHWGKIMNNKVVFTSMNKGAVYLPVYYVNGIIMPAAFPVILKDSVTMTVLKPDMIHRQTVIAERKSTDSKVLDYSKRMVGGKFQFSNNSDYSDALDAYIVETPPKVCFQTINLNITKPYKYFRYYGSIGSNAEIAEIELYESGTGNKISGKVKGKDFTFNDIGLAKAFDGNVLSYYNDFGANDAWVGLEFDTPRLINKLVYLPHNDDNFIRDGELYELYYWDNKWISLGRQSGSIKTQSLTYKNVPTNALFLLRNLTKGREERIFTYENGKQVWW